MVQSRCFEWPPSGRRESLLSNYHVFYDEHAPPEKLTDVPCLRRCCFDTAGRPGFNCPGQMPCCWMPCWQSSFLVASVVAVWGEGGGGVIVR